jgi:hypothetical protein
MTLRSYEKYGKIQTVRFNRDRNSTQSVSAKIIKYKNANRMGNLDLSK